MLKKMIFILFPVLLLGICFFLYLQWDVKSGYEDYTKSHSLVESPVYQGELSLYPEGSKLYPALFKDIKRAKKYIYIHFFIIREDPVSMKFLELLQKKAENGAVVLLSVDRIGGKEITKKTIEKLEKSGVKFTFSRKAGIHHFFYTINHRNHRKFVVIDGLVSYLGGFNIGEEYLGQVDRFGYWRDYHLRIAGEGTREIEKQFLKDWEEDTGEKISVKRQSFAEKDGSHYQMIFSTGEELEHMMLSTIKQAKKSLVIATPYFIPSNQLMNALIAAKKQGVVIDIIVPDNTDAWFTKPPSYPKTEALLKNGVNIYLYTKGFFHGKVMIIDGRIANISTANWDPRSFYLNDEASCLIFDAELIKTIQAEIDEDKKNSRKLTKKIVDEIPQWERSFMKTPEWIYYYF
ncbi:phospholipase D-like domain-containing protein [Metabacillus idriensis]|uniref:phospholipase D-like domain-containing protein n=1 Tax=Metabacillus idriensis TaxID=324768 RepID=UPI0028141910|nr:phospholipase D-like domain-containing protein [Metabacillus idriensis]MDR0139505.1 phospholipase D-like domain-containing protein [Metabacillus idriensis]